jgi:signal transduction histidine kinase
MPIKSEKHRTPSLTEEIIACRSQVGSSSALTNETSPSFQVIQVAECGATTDAHACSCAPEKTGPSVIKTGLFANLNHEARSPLNAIIGLSELLLSETAAPSMSGNIRPKDDFVARINSAGLQILDLLDSAIDMTLIEDGVLPPDKRLLCVNDLILDVIDRLTPAAQQFGISFQTLLDPDLPCFMLDAVRVRHALRCVIDNAIKYSKADGVVDIWATLSAQRGIIVTVADRGVGICRKDLEGVFLPLQKRVPSTARRYNGAGVGLALAKKYIEYHDGKIWLTSKPDIGTTVEIVLPHCVPPEQSG